MIIEMLSRKLGARHQLNLGLLAVWSLTLVFLFQNCGKGFSPDSALANLSLNAQCRTGVQSARVKALADAGKMQCENQGLYSCETRSFRPANAEGVSEERFCINAAGSETCAKHTIRKFNTSGAAAAATSAQLAEGGDYNRDEIRCAYIDPADPLAILSEEGLSAELALGKVVETCQGLSKRTLM